MRLTPISRSQAAALGLATCLSACGGASFGGGSPASSATPSVPELAAPSQTSSSTSSSTSTGSQSDGVDAQTLAQLQALPNGSAVASCLQQWGSNAPSAQQLLSFRTLSQSVGDAANASVFDPDTGTPEVVLIQVTAGGASNLDLKLANQQAWYCLDATVGDAANVLVAVACKAHYAAATTTGDASNIQVNQSCP